jgi:hypothetical protein
LGRALQRVVGEAATAKSQPAIVDADDNIDDHGDGAVAMGLAGRWGDTENRYM